MMQGFLESSKKYSNYEMTCPVLKGNYSATRFPITFDIPPIVPESKFKVFLKILVQVPKSKKLIEAFSSEILGRFTRELDFKLKFY